MAEKLYDEQSIQSLSPLEFTRLRPGVYCGSTEYATQPVIEIVSNAIDEFKAGHGNVINVTIYPDKRCSVQDYAQGFIINSVREDGKTILQAAFDTLNTSGKFTEDGVYEGTALGLNGIGSKLTNFLAHWLVVKSCRDGKFEKITFKEGVFEKREIGTTTEQGTYVEWLPSEEFFTSNEVEIPRIKELFHVLVCLCPGLTINLKTPKETITYYSENGLNDLVDDKAGEYELINNRMSMSFDDGGKNKMDMVITYTSKYSLNMISYVNTGETDAGPHITQIKTILTREFNKFFKEKKWLKSTDTNFSGDDIQEGLLVAFNITAPGISYDAQTKSRIVKIDMSPFSAAIVDNLQYWFAANEKDIKMIFDKANSARKAREAAKKARDAAREGKKEKKNKLLNLPTKLVDANSKKRQECELYICEGDSAAGGLIEIRDSETVAVFPIRGKMINLYKNSTEKVLANAEVNNLKKALGLDVDIKTGKLIYDIEKLRYGKILTACDADPDGEAIKNLILTCIWTICPELILNGHVYITIPPLYRITKGKDKYIYLKDDAALEEYKNLHKGEKFVINRNKGLGEQDSSELGPCLLDKETRNIAQIIVEDRKKAEILFETLMGTSVPPRRAWLLEHSEEASDNLW